MQKAASNTSGVTVVIPSYNRRDSVLLLLDDLMRQEGIELEIIIVDDKSPDDTNRQIRAKFPQVRILENSVNSGPAFSRNEGIRAATHECILGLDSDVRVPDTRLAAKIIHRFEQHPEASMLALRVIGPDGVSDDMPRWCHPFPAEGYAQHHVWTDYFSGTGYAGRKHKLIEAGLFPSILYMHHEEVELAYRMLDIGGAILHCPDLLVHHFPHPVANRGRVEIYFHPRNQVLIAFGLFPTAYAFLHLLPRTAFQLLRSIVKGYFPTYLRAIRDAIKMLPERMETSRRLKPQTRRRIRRLRATPAVLS